MSLQSSVNDPRPAVSLRDHHSHSRLFPLAASWPSADVTDTWRHFWPGRVSIAALLTDSLWDHSEHNRICSQMFVFFLWWWNYFLQRHWNFKKTFMKHFYRPSSVGWIDSFSFHHAAFSHNYVIINNIFNQVFVWVFVAAAQFSIMQEWYDVILSAFNCVFFVSFFPFCVKCFFSCYFWPIWNFAVVENSLPNLKTTWKSPVFKLKVTYIITKHRFFIISCMFQFVWSWFWYRFSCWRLRGGWTFSHEVLWYLYFTWVLYTSSLLHFWGNYWTFHFSTFVWQLQSLFRLSSTQRTWKFIVRVSSFLASISFPCWKNQHRPAPKHNICWSCWWQQI